MTDEEIIRELGLASASENTKQLTLGNIYTVVELRTMTVVETLLTDEEVDHMEQMEKDGATKDEILWWLGENVASAHEAIEAMTRDYVEEMKQKMASIQNSLELS